MLFVGTFVTKVQATARQNPNPIVYSLKNDKGWFQIDNSSGVITAAKTIDREVGVVHKVLGPASF